MASWETVRGTEWPALGSLLPSLEPTFVEQQRQHLGSDFLMATQMCSCGVEGPVLYCQQSKQ